MPKPARDDEFLETYHRLGGNVSAVAREMSLSRSGARHYVRKLGLTPGSIDKPLPKVEADAAASVPLPARGKVKRFLLSCAQNNNDPWESNVWAPFWENLMALREHDAADLRIARFTYNHETYQGSRKPGDEKPVDKRPRFAVEIEPYVCDERIEIAPGLVWCGDLQILPTAVNPLSSLDNFTGPASTIVPHAKMRMESVPAQKRQHAKLMYTTGTVTKRDYIKAKAGQKADFHHVYGALLVEVDSEGNWFVRQLNADQDGTIYDLDRKVEGGVVTTGHRVEAINWGDMHTRHLDRDVARLGWGQYGMLEGTMVEALRPRVHVVHDLLDFYARNHHDVKDPHAMFRRFARGQEVVEDEIKEAAGLLTELADLPDAPEVVVVDSNHDDMFRRWLRDGDYRVDHANALFFLEMQLELYRAIDRNDREFHLVEHAMRRAGAPTDVKFLRVDDSYTLADGRIEAGMHGHLGPNGARGTPKNIAKVNTRANTGHTHSARIVDGVYVAGTSSKLDLDYTSGPSSWSHSHVVTYPNGKRTIITMWGGKWRA